MDVEFLEGISKKILISLLEERSLLNDDKTFFENHPKLFDNATKTRKQKYKRKRILIFVDKKDPKLAQDVQIAIKNIDDKYKNKTVCIPKECILITSGTIKEIKDYDFKCSNEYSDIIAFIKGSEKENSILFELIDSVKKDKNSKFHLYPNLVLRYDKKPNIKNLENAFESTLFVSRQINNEKKAELWNEYAFNDNLFKQIRGQIDKAYRNKNLNEVLNSYGFKLEKDNVICKKKQNILILGDSRLKVEDLKKILIENNLPIDNFKFKLDYKKGDFDFEDLRYSSKYSELMIGPIAHKVKGTRGYSSGIALIEENKDKYPRLIKLRSNGELKITGESFSKGLKETYLYKFLNSKEKKK